MNEFSCYNVFLEHLDRGQPKVSKIRYVNAYQSEDKGLIFPQTVKRKEHLIRSISIRAEGMYLSADVSLVQSNGDHFYYSFLIWYIILDVFHPKICLLHQELTQNFT